MIRRAIAQDINSLAQLYEEFHLFHVLGVPDRLRVPEGTSSDAAGSAAELSTNLRAIMQRDDAAIFVAEVAGELVGLAEVYLHQDEENPFTVAHYYGHLQSLIVSAPFRKSGLGKHLVAAAQQWAKEHHATEMQLDIWEFAEGPLHFYEKLGYRTLKRHMVVDLD